MKKAKLAILLLPNLILFLIFPGQCLAIEEPTVTPDLEATIEATPEVEETLSPVVDLEASQEATLEASPSATPTEKPTPTEQPPTPTPEEKKPALILGIFSPGELIITSLIVLLVLGGLICFYLDSRRKNKDNS